MIQQLFIASTPVAEYSHSLVNLLGFLWTGSSWACWEQLSQWKPVCRLFPLCGWLLSPNLQEVPSFPLNMVFMET